MSCYLQECIDSIISQSHSDWELIAVNDFSTDNSFEMLSDYAKKDDRIKVFNNHRKGIVPALSLAFSKSSGEFITRMDADDRMTQKKLELLKSALDNDKSIATGKVKYFSDKPISEGYLGYENWLNARIDNDDHWKFVYRECVIASPNWLVKRDCFEKDIDLNDLEYPEDYDMVLKWYGLGYDIVSCPELTHEWREHPDRTSRNNDAYQQPSFFQLKTKRFIEYEIFHGERIQVLGAGDKGKYVAQELLAQNIPFDWFDFKAEAYNNPIFGQKIQSLSDLKKGVKTILTVWPKNDSSRAGIRQFLSEYHLVFGKNCWLF